MKRVAALLVLIGLTIMAGYACYSVGVAGIQTRSIRDSERCLLLTVDSLSEFGLEDLARPACESWVAKVNVDASLELEYEFDSSASDENVEFLFFKSEAEIVADERTAAATFEMQISAARAGVLMVSGRELLPCADPLPRIADQVYSGTIVQDERIVGNLVVLRQGRIVHTLMLLGVYIPDGKELADVLRPVIRQSIAFQAHQTDI